MNELIKITNQDGNNVVSARELYDFLEVNTDFTTWCKRMFEYGFTENTDYALLKIGELNNQPNTKVDYALTLDCAKEISMIQRTDKGKIARLYFIEMEKIALTPKILSRKELALMVIESENARELAESKVKELQPKAEITDLISNSGNLIALNEAAKTLGTGRTRFIKLLKDKNILRSNGTPYQQYIEQGYFKTKVKPIKMGNKVIDYVQTFLTGKGLVWITNKI